MGEGGWIEAMAACEGTTLEKGRAMDRGLVVADIDG